MRCSTFYLSALGVLSLFSWGGQSLRTDNCRGIYFLKHDFVGKYAEPVLIKVLIFSQNLIEIHIEIEANRVESNLSSNCLCFVFCVVIYTFNKCLSY